MKLRSADGMKRMALLVLPLLLCGCTPASSSAATTLENVRTFIEDFARQILATWLL